MGEVTCVGGPVGHGGALQRRVLRWALLCLGLMALVMAQLVGGHTTAKADTPTTTTTSAATAPSDADAAAAPSDADAADSGPGSAIASASVLGAVPIVGNTNLAVSAGDSEASYQSDEARSSSQTLSLGGLGVVLANTPVCGYFALPASEQPQPLTDDTDGGTPTASNNAPAGTETVTANASPESASGTSTPVGQVIPGVLSVGGTSTSAVSYTATGERTADASVTLALNIANGLIELNGLTWSAQQQSGTTAVSQGSFSVGSLKVGPTVIGAPTEAQLSSAVALANTLLHTFGLTLVMPTVKVDPSTQTVTVTPLEITVGKSALSDVLISPLISQLSALESEVNGQTESGSDCSNVKVLLNNLANPAETVANVALGSFSNGGGFDLDVGGVNADTLPPPDFPDPFGSATLPVLGSLGLPVTGSLGSGLPAGLGLGLPATGAVTPTTPSTTIPPQSVSAGSGTLSSATHCTTTSPAGHPGCWSGDAEVVGSVAVVAGGALFLADLRKSRRSRRKVKEATT
jgi:hypothetical protein